MNDISAWIKTIETASTQTELDAISEAWRKIGETFVESDWGKFHQAMANRKMIINGEDTNKPAF